MIYARSTSTIYGRASAWCRKNAFCSAAQFAKRSQPLSLTPVLRTLCLRHDWPAQRSSLNIRGYETYIQEGSTNLSGGQRQRLAIARALIGDPRILILDEATSALDAESEAIVNANLLRIAKGRTLVIISHRLSVLVQADTVLVLERGRLYDSGSHDELLERCDIYRGLWHQQNRHLQSRSSHGLFPLRAGSAARAVYRRADPDLSVRDSRN